MHLPTGTVISGVALASAGLISFGLYLFQPWALFTTTTVHDSLPSGTLAPFGASQPSPSSPAASSPSAPAPSASQVSRSPSGPAPITAAGAFKSYAHPTSGTAQLLRLPGGSAVLRLTNLSTSNGPDVHVWLSSRPAGGAADAGTGTWVELGGLKGNRGDHNYLVPAGTTISDYQSVVLWCRCFSVAFGAAPLAAS